MITLPQIIDELLQKNPFLADAISEDLVNCSALARKFQPIIAKQYIREEPSLSSLVMALKRWQEEHRNRNEALPVIETKRVRVRSGLTEFVLRRSGTVHRVHRRLAKEVDESDAEPFLHFSRGSREVLIIVSEDLRDMTERLIDTETVIDVAEQLSALSVSLPSDTADTPGVYYPLLRSLAWEGISVVELSSTYDELTVFLSENDIDMAFSLLMGLGK